MNDNTNSPLWKLDEAVEIYCKDIGMTYRAEGGRDVKAIVGINLKIKKGEFVSLLGPSGCGKTTLLRIIGDLLMPTEGSVYIDGGLPQNARLKKKYGMVFQSAVLYEWRTVWKNVRLPLEILKVPRAEVPDRINRVLELVELTKFKNHYPHELSGGMQQRVSIARAFAIDPEILLMDEPFSALDEFTREKLHEDLLRIWRQTNKTVVFVTHNIAESVFLSDKVFVLSPHPGRLSAEIEIDLPRPRLSQMRNSPRFNELVVKIRNSFEGI
ncbi:MAG: ABC transporter ATP-binding protein [Treponema sp.]|jgi:NitT/TauT family transport system ATP-binding protein|nr:ABC transporter ATP-binding protein [Treponema sp.]